MDNLDIPILKKAYEFYKLFHGYSAGIPRLDRYTIWQRCENILLEIIEYILLASQTYKDEKLTALHKASLKLDMLKIFIRLLKDVKTIDNSKYVKLEVFADEIGRMLGGWIRSVKEL
jgi:hypothetical protein